MEPTGGTNDVRNIQESRGYQMEMLEESLKRNIVVAMDTGSGKTHIAILRVEAELERCAQEQLIWFLCPTVALAQQQYSVITNHLRSVQSRFLSGNDGVDRWSDQQTWDKVLQDIRIVVSTHQVLLDALTHAFVGMARLALLVFDEAHHCISNHPANRIMRDFYHPSLKARHQVPHILGLTASPIMNNKGGGLQTIEQNIDAISKTPKAHRSELLQFVHQPKIITLTFQGSCAAHSPLLQNLTRLHREIDIETDPYVIRLRTKATLSDSSLLHNALMGKKTYCQDQIKGLWSMAIAVNEELGSWASDWYILSCIDKFKKKRFTGPVNFESLDESEWSYLNAFFALCIDRVPTASNEPEGCSMTPKVQRLLRCLDTEVGDGFSGLLFVQTRASVHLLARLLSAHGCIRDRLRVGTFVGTSNNDKRKSSISELLGLGDQNESLDDLRSGKKNLIIATSVLEEGIDVSACNVVLCFQKPLNLKSFIQRRGRARNSKSRFIIMVEEGSRDAVTPWKQLEEEMKQIYMDDMRQLVKIQEEEEDEQGERMFMVESTGAKINLQDAVGHLHHFCNTLPRTPYSDPKPVFSFEEKPVPPSARLFRAKVVLPKSVDISVRKAQSKVFWQSQKLAKQDAAFEAYVALYHAGLVNDHLLPLIAYDEAAMKAYSEVEKRPSLVSAKQQLSPWPTVAAAWNSGSRPYQAIVSFSSPESVMPQLRVISPFKLSWTEQLRLYPDSRSNIMVDIDHQEAAAFHGDVILSDNVTRLLLLSIFRRRMDPSRSGFPLLFEPILDVEDWEDWLQRASGERQMGTFLRQPKPKTEAGIIRDLRDFGSAYIFHGIEYRDPRDSKYALPPEATIVMEEQEPLIKAKKLPKRTDFLHPTLSKVSTLPDAKTFTYLPLSTSTMDNLPFAYAQLAMFIPAIMHHIEVTLLTDDLCDGLLAPVQFEDRQLVCTATTASAAGEVYNYQKLEFLGDCCLKFFTSINIMSQHLNWHEGYLSHQKDHIVSNGRLALASQQTGLDQYIRTKAFTGFKWRPSYIEDLLIGEPAAMRELSTKTLADVVEALLGAAFVDGGQSKVLSCLSIFLPEVPWQPLEECRGIILGAATPEEYNHFPAHFQYLETLVNHVFNNKSVLVEAVTHPSHLGPDPTPSYDRLEFCGDSVLDYIVTTRIFKHSSSLATPRMHLLRTATVNANFLAFTCMQHCIVVFQKSLPTNKTGTEFSNPDAQIPHAIWHFMRHSHTPELMIAQDKCAARFVELQPAIVEALAHGDTYPWTLLTALGAEKYFSDLIESIIAAIYVDTGSIPACERFLTTLGILPYLDRALNENLHVIHPKEALGILAGNNKVTYELIEEKDKTEIEATAKGYNIRLSVGGTELVIVRGARTRIEGETRAAEKAIVLLKEKVAETHKSKDEETKLLRQEEGDEVREEDLDDGKEDNEATNDDAMDNEVIESEEEEWGTPKESMDDEDEEG